MSERSTFSPFWHRVRVLKPRLRPHVQITRQHYRGRRWHVVHDPSSNQFFRLNAVAHEFVGLLDGVRTVDDVWQHSLSRHGDSALTQNEVIQLLSQLFAGNLLTADVPPETEQLLTRGKDRLAKRVQAQAVGLMYFKCRVFNPDPLLSYIEPLFRPLLNRFGFIAWAIFVLAAIFSMLPHVDRLVSGVEGAVAPDNWLLLAAGFVVLKLIHEAGHGLICRRFGGHVPEFGLMLLVLFPSPYVDASAAWAFSNKWHRIAVGAGGMIFELTIAAAAAFTWLNTPDESVLHQVAYNAMLTASISTVLFNANPLMKFDGYYMLSDLLEVPNLMQRSQQMLKFLFQRHVFKVRQATAPTSSLDEALILIAFGASSGIYRIFLFVSITLYVMGLMFGIGVFLACWTAAAWFLMPLGGFIHWLTTNPQLAERRGRAIATAIVLAMAAILAVGFIPAPDRRRAQGVVESAERSGVFFGAEGIVQTAHVRAGDRVKKGDPIATVVSDRLVAQLALTKGQLLEAESKLRVAIQHNQAAAQVAEEYVRTLSEQAAYLESKVARLTLTAPQDGVVVTGDPQAAVGRHVKDGQPLCDIIDDSKLHVVATLAQTEASWVAALPVEGYEVELRRNSRVRDVIEARADRVVDAGQTDLPHAALSFAGGGAIETRQDDRTGLQARQQFFRAYFSPVAPGADIGVPGERVVVRVSLPAKPLLTQWVDRLYKLTQGRAKL